MSPEVQRCPSCFQPSNEDVCPNCGYEETEERNPLVLDLGFELDGRYRIGHVLGKPGGFGITYLAFDERLQARVALKEYLPREIAARGSDGASVRLYSADEEETFEYGLDRFLGEARALAQFDHANIVGVQDFFEANGTAYLAMDYYEGKTLKQYLAEQPEGQMDPDNATEIMLRVLDGLKEVHAEGYLHRDVKPSNIYLTAGGRPILIDFGAARLALGERSKSLSVVMTEGYAPYEQYHRKGDQGPWTDMYGCGATLYRMVTGETPPPAAERVVEDDLRPPHDLNAEVSPALSRGIVGALAVQEEDRPQTAAALQEHLQGGGRNAGGSQEPSANREKEPPPPPSSEDHALDGGASEGRVASGAEPEHEQDSGVGWPTVAVGVLLAAALGLGGLAVAFYPSGSESTAQETEQSASEDPSSNPSTRSKTEQLLKEARGHLDAGRLTSPEGTNALAAVRQALKQNPESEKAQELLGRIADRLVKKGAAAREEGNLQAAMSFFERSLEIKSQPGVRDNLQTVRSRIKQRKKVRELLGQVRSRLSQESASVEELQEATAAARDAKELRPESREAEELLSQIARQFGKRGDSLRAKGKLRAAVGAYEQSLEVEKRPGIQEKLETIQGHLQERRKTQKLLASARSVLSRDDPSAESLKQAVGSVQEVLGTDSGNEEAQALLGRIARRLEKKGDTAREAGKLSLAADLYEQSLKVQDRSSVEDKRSMVRDRLKDMRTKAERLLNRVRSALDKEDLKDELERIAGLVQKLQNLRPENDKVQTLLNRLADRYAELGKSAESSGQLKKASRYYKASLEIRRDPKVRNRFSAVRKVLRDPAQSSERGLLSNPVTGSEKTCSDGQAGGFPCEEITLKSFLPIRKIGGPAKTKLSDIWGWTDPKTGIEYALVGRVDGTAFVDISNPLNPFYVGELRLPGEARISPSRDIKVYENHAFVVADNANDHGMQVFDLTRLRDVERAEMPVTFEQDTLYEGVNSVRNIVINKKTGYAYAVGTSGGGESCGGGLHMINIQDPMDPTFEGCFADESTGRSGTGYTHDAQCVVYDGPDSDYRGREICIGSNETAISIADVTNKDKPVAISTGSYPDFGYIHQGWLGPNQRYFYQGDNLDEIKDKTARTRILVWDLKNLDSPALVNQVFLRDKATDQNLYVENSSIYLSSYKSGVRILDIRNPERPDEVAYFDTHPHGENGPGLQGAFSNYPYFESGIIVVSSNTEGLFILERASSR